MENGGDLSKLGITMNRECNGYIDSITAPLLNLAFEISGFDLSASVGIGSNFTLSLQHSQLLLQNEVS